MERNTNHNELTHHGVKGMKWGVRKAAILGGATAAAISSYKYSKALKKNAKRVQKEQNEQRKDIGKMSDSELNARINRMRLEKQYAELVSPANQKSVSAGKAFVADIAKQSGKVIATQLATYALGTAVNATAKAIAVKQPNESYASILKESYKRSFKDAFAGGNAVNARKGQKDK